MARFFYLRFSSWMNDPDRKTTYVQVSRWNFNPFWYGSKMCDFWPPIAYCVNVILVDQICHSFIHNIQTIRLSGLKFHRVNEKNTIFHLIAKFIPLPVKSEVRYLQSDHAPLKQYYNISIKNLIFIISPQNVNLIELDTPLWYWVQQTGFNE